MEPGPALALLFAFGVLITHVLLLDRIRQRALETRDATVETNRLLRALVACTPGAIARYEAERVGAGQRAP